MRLATAGCTHELRGGTGIAPVLPRTGYAIGCGAVEE